MIYGSKSDPRSCRGEQAAEPVGAFMIRNGDVEWKPVFDLSATVRRGQLVGAVALLVLWAVIRALRGR